MNTIALLRENQDPTDDEIRAFLAGNLCRCSGVEQLTNFHLDELEQLGIVDLVDLVQEDEHVRNVDLTGEQQVLM